jgi:hypothetical protein
MIIHFSIRKFEVSCEYLTYTSSDYKAGVILKGLKLDGIYREREISEFSILSCCVIIMLQSQTGNVQGH